MNTTMAMNATCQTEALSAALHVGMYLTSRTTPMRMMMSSITLSHAELVEITGYHQPSKQLAELHRRGFHRAYIGRHGLVLERAHYEAVCAGASERNKPKLRPILRTA